MNEYGATIKIPSVELNRWNRLLGQKRVDYEKEGFKENQTVFIRTVTFADGNLADLKVCTNLNGESLYSEVVIYDKTGKHLWLSDAGDILTGEWRLGGWIDGMEVSYRLFVEEDPGTNPFESLRIDREDFREMVRHELENGVTSVYSAQLAEAIADGVARDVVESADPKEWNTGDIRLGTGRVLLEACGIAV